MCAGSILYLVLRMAPAVVVFARGLAFLWAGFWVFFFVAGSLAWHAPPGQMLVGGVLTTVLLLNIYAVAVGLSNVAFQTNDFYVCRKPENPSLLDWFGPRPLYIAVGESFTLGMFAHVAAFTPSPVAT